MCLGMDTILKWHIRSRDLSLILPLVARYLSYSSQNSPTYILSIPCSRISARNEQAWKIVRIHHDIDYRCWDECAIARTMYFPCDYFFDTALLYASQWYASFIRTASASEGVPRPVIKLLARFGISVSYNTASIWDIIESITIILGIQTTLTGPLHITGGYEKAWSLCSIRWIESEMSGPYCSHRSGILPRRKLNLPTWRVRN